MAQITKGVACAWGVGVASTTSYGRVIGFRHTKGSAETQIQDQDGDIATIIFHGIFEEAELEVVPTSATYTTPAIGDELTITDSLGDGATAEGLTTKYYVSGVVANQTVGDAARLTLSVKRFPDINS